LSVWSTLRAHDAHAPCRRSAREGERPTAARSTCASRVLTELRARAARKASARRRVRRYPAAHDPRRHWQCRHTAAALFARRCPSRRAMTCGKSSGRPDAPLSHLATGRPPRCALLPLETAVHWYRTPSRLCRLSRRSSSARRWLAGTAPALRDRPDASSGVPEPWSLTRGVRDGRFACHRVGAPGGRRTAAGLLLATR